MATLILRLAAPLQSWGADSKFEVRKTNREPTALLSIGCDLSGGTGKRGWNVSAGTRRSVAISSVPSIPRKAFLSTNAAALSGDSGDGFAHGTANGAL